MVYLFTINPTNIHIQTNIITDEMVDWLIFYDNIRMNINFDDDFAEFREY
jgi:hypothetical protein